ncbi:MAG: domain S-box protein [Fibrobacteres bacterium]|nr:domain S-box protein [Fibrobacterota bacterium]
MEMITDPETEASRGDSGAQGRESLESGQIRILEMVATGAPLADTLDAMLRVCEAQSGDMLCSILLLDPDGVHVRHGAAPSLPPEYLRAIDGSAIGPRAGSCGTAAYIGRQVIVEDIGSDPLWDDYRQFALPHDLHACWSTPVFDDKRKVVATFAMYFREPGIPTARHTRLIEVFTHLAAIAIMRHRTEAALRVSEGRYRRLMDSNIIGVIIAHADGRIREANDRYLQMVGYSREELAAGLVNWAAMTPPEWEAKDLKAVAELSASGITSSFEKEYFHKDGHRVPIKVRVAALDGPMGELIALIEDLTVRKRDEAERRRIYDRISDAFVALDADWRYVFVNAKAAQILGRTPESLLGRNVWEEFPEGGDGRFRLACERAMAEQEAAVTEDYFPPNGRWFENHIYPSPQGLSIYIHDITNRKRSEKQIREQLDELLRWQNVTVGREERVQELKAEVNGLLVEMGRPPRYAGQGRS